MTYFPEVKKNFGFGCMRFPMIDKAIDYDELCKMIDLYLESGFNYFDTAHGYHGGLSETALRDCLTSRYPRESYILTNKLSTWHFTKNEEIIPLFESQLEACGVDYFDFYLMHAQDRKIYQKYKECNAYETVLELLKEGRIKHFGISFHDKASVLDTILTEHPEIEVVQIQFNYADYDDTAVESRKVYEVCRKHNKPVIVMEPVKGGSLTRLPDDAVAVLDKTGRTPANLAIRFAASFDGIFMVISGMGSMDMMRENIGFMQSFEPLSKAESDAVDEIVSILKKQDIVPCTSCNYCTPACPMNIPIPEFFACLNRKKSFKNWNTGYYYTIHTNEGGKASACIKCGACEALCPQHLPIRELLVDVANEFEVKK